MSKTYIVISNMVDSTIKSYQPDIDFKLFRNLELLSEHIETTPLRADTLFLTRDVFPQINTSLNFMLSMLDNPFLKVDEVVYITENHSEELKALRYVLESVNANNWEIFEGRLTREYVSGIINGTARTDDNSIKRKTIFRVSREEYVKNKIKESDTDPNQQYLDDEQYLEDIPDVEIPVSSIINDVVNCSILNIVSDCKEESAYFAILVGQYMSLSGKTVLVEKDKDYHFLTECITKSEIECMLIEMKELYENTSEVLERIVTCKEKLIVLGSIERFDYDYSFVINILYANLSSKVSTIVKENYFNEAPIETSYAVVIKPTIPSILEMCEVIDSTSTSNISFVCVNAGCINELSLKASSQVKTILDDLLSITDVRVTIVNIESLHIGKDSSYDIKGMLGGVLC